MSAQRPYAEWSDAELKAEIERFAPYLREAERRHDEAQREARLRRAESVSAALAREWPAFRLDVTRALAQVDRRLKALEAPSGTGGSSQPIHLQRLPDSAYTGALSDSAIDAALRNHDEALKAVGFPEEPGDLAEHILGVKVGTGLLGLFVDAWNVRNCEILGGIFARLSALEKRDAGPANNQPNPRG
jgi:hypothetical protein